jgi:hypothetical protein
MAVDTPAGSRLISSPAGSSGPVDPDEGEHRALLKATVKATPADAHGQGTTIHHMGLAPRIQNNPRWTSADVLDCEFLEHQNRWSASLAMSTDGSFPSRPGQS